MGFKIFVDYAEIWVPISAYFVKTWKLTYKTKNQGRSVMKRPFWFSFLMQAFSSSLNLTWTQASWASVYMTRSTLDDSLNTLYIRLPCSVCASVRVRNFDSESNSLSAYFTFCHQAAPPYNLVNSPANRTTWILYHKISEIASVFWKKFRNFLKIIKFGISTWKICAFVV